MLVEIVIFLLTFVLAYFYYTYYRIHKFLRQKDVKFIPGLPVYGNALESMNNRKHMMDEIVEIYNAFPNERYVAYIEASTPIILIRDPELIKAITVKNFDYFMDHKQFFPEADIFGMSMFGMKGDRWRDMRTTLSPAFTGSKMRLMLPSMVEVAGYSVDYLKEHAGEEINVDDLIRRYTNDVIASVAFGLQVNSYKDKDNEFFRVGQDLLTFTYWQYCVLFLYAQAPFIAKMLRLKMFTGKNITFLREIVVSTMEYREKNNVERPDMIQLLMEASKGTLKASQVNNEDNVGFAAVEEELKPQGQTRKWEIDDLVGQVFFFFTAGFDTTAATLVLCIHELALNVEIQEKLYEEVRSFKNTNDLTYENIGKLKYLDCVLNETLRKWSPAIIMDRKCVKPYELPPPHEGGKPYQLNPGDYVYNMVNAIHLDPKYYPEPMKFNPERFSDENKHNIAPFTFMPFGMGPRNCIGSRLALMELKVLLFNLILNFKIVKSENTSTTLRLKPEGFLIKMDKGTFVKFEQRQ
ncbi:unnamed protein product [Diatraea saccharalis]|uniref:unspecific monooxygenase n=1 Tax=Diatraea saccharalis TaxID=40085 RepID=A0A9N9QYJ2_9NEOP|nr:unnamed protein product [Diatraea saccharalis]